MHEFNALIMRILVGFAVTLSRPGHLLSSKFLPK